MNSERAMKVRRFSLVELMTSLSVALVLAAVAVPVVAGAQLKAMRSEAATNAAALHDALVVADHADALVAYGGQLLPWQPRDWTGVDRRPVDWPEAAIDSPWRLVDWAPDGAVRCAYAAVLDPQSAVAMCNLDQDAVHYVAWDEAAGLGSGCTSDDPTGSAVACTMPAEGCTCF